MVAAVPDIHCLRDPTRGGLATTLNELAHQSGVGMRIREAAIPVRPEVAAACELLGLDPLYVANEGKLIAICPAARAGDPAGRPCAPIPWAGRPPSIGEVVADPHQFVQMETAFGGEPHRRLAGRGAVAADLLKRGLSRFDHPSPCI